MTKEAKDLPRVVVTWGRDTFKKRIVTYRDEEDGSAAIAVEMRTTDAMGADAWLPLPGEEAELALNELASTLAGSNDFRSMMQKIAVTQNGAPPGSKKSDGPHR